jgi:hypothetical protein
MKTTEKKLFTIEIKKDNQLQPSFLQSFSDDIQTVYTQLESVHGKNNVTVYEMENETGVRGSIMGII